ncbi:polysaccharide biosynthesis protein [Lachnospiraceae bacterium BX10]|uniref:Polysaccharide biosynthesis protein n=3 Tax=Lachnospirales TaxID=3085636 RepID=A0ABR7NQI3_9FIRM|nr:MULTISPECIES: polysaccharide biosynthesis protein [Lachnospiraceae]MBC8598384.1 polysaccharide biosynthesis protein [Enterocloster hominis]MCU6798398.1 polysaccharide biosynthesis protein [Alitiscatomonas aceti]
MRERGASRKKAGSRPEKTGGESNFVVQGSILAIASIVVRIIGIAYRIPMINIIGDEGMGYYGTAFNVYNIALLLSSYSLPLAVSKMVSVRLARKQYRNSVRILRAALVYATVVGALAAAVIWFGADFFAREVFFMPYAAFALKTLAPTVWIMAYLGVFRGYYQGQGTMVPTALSQVFEQIVNAIVSVAAGSWLFNQAIKVEILRGESGSGYSNSWGAAGGTIGTGAGAFTALVFLLLLFAAYQRTIRKKVRRDRSGSLESYGTITKILFFTVVPVVVSSAIYNVNSVLDNGLLAYNFKSLGMEEEFISQWGVYTGKYHLLINVPMAVSNALSSSLIPSVSRAVATGDRRMVKKKVAAAIRFSLLIAIPSAVGLTVLAGPVNNLLFSGDNDLAVQMTLYGSIAVVFYSVSTVTNAILQGIDRMRLPIVHALTALVLHLAAMEVMVLVFHMGIFSMVFANILFAVIMCFLNHRSIRKILGYRQEVKKTILLPAAASAVMGAAAVGVYKLIHLGIQSNAVCTLGAVAAAVAVYGVLLVKLGCLDEDELHQMPGGTRLLQMFRKLRLM